MVKKLLTPLLICLSLLVVLYTNLETSDDNGIIQLSLKPEKGSKFKFGQTTKALFTIKNLSKKALVVRKIKPVTNQGEDTIVLSNSVYGSAVKSEKEDAYHHSTFSQTETGCYFHTGFLLPNQEVSVSCPYRAISKVERFEIHYVLAANKYDGTTESLNPLKIYLLDRNAKDHSIDEKGFTSFGYDIYRPFIEENWIDICKKAPQTDPLGGSETTSRTVFVFELPKSKILTLKASVELEDITFPVKSAREVAAKITDSQADNIRLAYSAALSGYIVLEDDSSWLLKNEHQKNRGQLFPAVPFGIFRDLDWSKEVEVHVGDNQDYKANNDDASWKFWDTYPVFYGDGMYTHGEFIKVNKTNVLDFLGRVKEKKGNITEYRYFFRARYFVLNLPKEASD